MGDCINYLDTPMKFIKEYSFKDKKEIYTNGTELVPLFRVEQMLGHYMPSWIPISERLPELHTDVLVALADNGDTTRDIDCLIDDDGKIAWATYYGATDRVLAWMPLPERYTGD